MKAINIKEKFGLFTEQWSPKILADLNDYHIKIARIQGDFTWHSHDDTDEAFLVIQGIMRMDYRDKQIPLKEGELVVVPRGVEHKPHAEEECWILMIEPSGTLNTGDAGGDRTVENPDRI